MRTAFIETLMDVARRREDVVLITGDLGFSVLEKFAEEFPERFLNTGVAEQSMMGIAAGLALSDKKVFVYSIVPFATMRCLEQIRNDLCMHDLPVVIVGVGTGLYYGPAGSTHHAIEDVGVLRALPGMTIVDPGTSRETALAVEAIADFPHPVYLRLGRSEKLEKDDGPQDFAIGKGVVIEEGKDVVLISSGCIFYNVRRACRLLQAQGVSAGHLHLPTVKPIDRDLIRSVAEKVPAFVSVEENNVAGGLGSAVAEVLAPEGKARLKCLGINDHFVREIGSHHFLREKCGLSPEGIVRSIGTFAKVHAK